MSAGAVVAAEPALSQGRTGQPQNCRGRRVACGLAAAAVADCRVSNDTEAGLPWKNLWRRSVPSTSAIFRSRNFGFGARLNLVWKSTPKFSFRFLRQWFVRLRLRLISLRARRAARIARWITVRNAIAARAAIASQLSRRPLAREDFGVRSLDATPFPFTDPVLDFKWQRFD